MASPPRIAIVGLGGLYPTALGGAATTPERLWQLVLAGVTAARDVPPGRWLLPPGEAYSPRVAEPDHVYSRRGCFLDPFASPDGLDLPPDLLAGLDPVFHLTLRAGV